jgi:hypothetical protein
VTVSPDYVIALVFNMYVPFPGWEMEGSEQPGGGRPGSLGEYVQVCGQNSQFFGRQTTQEGREIRDREREETSVY